MSLFQTSVLKRELEKQDNFEIEKPNKEIDQMVYELYGLNEEEIKIVEGAV